ncbi:MAG: glutathione S-transferase [Myxococcota bacterium]|nr:glutathione S-transferase [Myxococcota bacterium]
MSDAGHFQHYGWQVSPYSAKTRAYLRFKQIPFDDLSPSAMMLFRTIKKAVGWAVMPTVQRPDGSWMQDSSEIIDWFEAEFTDRSIRPPGGAQQLASLLLELHGDEWLPSLAMHTRWNIPENARFALDEFAREGVPWLPRFLGRPLVRSAANRMRSYLPVLGVQPETREGIEAFGKNLIATLQVHFSAHPFLLGGRPCLGDFALFGPLWAHVYRDPGSKEWFDGAPAVRDWFERLLEPDAEVGEFLPDDEVPASLAPIFRRFFGEQFPFLLHLVATVDAWCEDNPEATRVPRSLGTHPFEIGGAGGERRLLTFSQWMTQRPLDAYAGLTPEQKASADAWLDRVGGAGLKSLRIGHRQVRRNFKLGLESSPGPV